MIVGKMGDPRENILILQLYVGMHQQLGLGLDSLKSATVQELGGEPRVEGER